MKNYIEAPHFSLDVACLNPSDNLFLAGSITGAHDWQKEMAFKKYDIFELDHSIVSATDKDIRLVDYFNVFNPRRVDFDASDPNVEKEQITWEYHCIHHCNHILFWFAPETLAPITLFELGSALNTHKHENIYIGIDPEYKRKNDVIIQTSLRDERLAKRIVYSKEDLAMQVLKRKI
jgi:hypothetical protein